MKGTDMTKRFFGVVGVLAAVLSTGCGGLYGVNIGKQIAYLGLQGQAELLYVILGRSDCAKPTAETNHQEFVLQFRKDAVAGTFEVNLNGSLVPPPVNKVNALVSAQGPSAKFETIYGTAGNVVIKTFDTTVTGTTQVTFADGPLETSIKAPMTDCPR
jgi:hypothetical protein